jgi:hypothetical protein
MLHRGSNSTIADRRGVRNSARGRRRENGQVLQRLAPHLMISPPAAWLILRAYAPRVTNRNERKAALARVRAKKSYRRRTVDKKVCATVEISAALIDRLVREGWLDDAKATSKKARDDALTRWLWFITTLK